MLESDYISLLGDSTMSSALNLTSYQFYHNLEEKDHFRWKINSKTIFICEIIIIILICRKLGSVELAQQKSCLHLKLLVITKIASFS